MQPSKPERRADERMARALEVAATTPAGDVPVGAIIFGSDGQELACGVNRREAMGDPTAHAEVEAIRAAAKALGTWRLDGCELVVTLEPCTMCAGAIVGARLDSVVFGAWEPRTGAVGSIVDVLRDVRQLHQVQVRAGVRADDCAALMTEFFDRLR